MSCGIHTTLHAKRKVDGRKCLAGNVLNLTLQEGIEGVRRFESAGSQVVVGDVHTGGQQGDGRLAAFFLAHRRELVFDGQIFGRIDDEFQSHVFYRATDLHPRVESHRALPFVFSHNGLDALRCRDVECGIHHVAGEVDRRSALEIERAQGDHGQFVVHFALVDGESARHSHIALRRHAESEITVTRGVDVTVSVGREIAAETRSLLDNDLHPHVHVRFLGLFRRRHHRDSVGKVGERDEIREIAARCQRGVGHHIGDVGPFEHSEASRHDEFVERAVYIGQYIGQQAAVKQRFVFPLGVDQRELPTDDINIDIGRGGVREIDLAAQRERHFVGRGQLVIPKFELRFLEFERNGVDDEIHSIHITI